MKSLMRTTSRGVAAGLAGVLVASATALLVAPALADDALPSAVSPHLEWQISTTFVEHLFTGEMYPGAVKTDPLPGVASDGAVFVEGPLFGGADDTFTFPQVSKATVGDEVVRTYGGSVTGTFVNAGTRYYSVKIAEPVVTVDGDGNGSIKATVSSEVYDNPGQVAGTTGPSVVTVAEIDSVVADGKNSEITPRWAGVIQPASEVAIGLGLPEGQPIDGNAFHPEFVGSLMKATRALFYQSSLSASQAKKTPALASVVARPAVSPTVAIASREDGLGITVKGTDFTAVTNPGDAGVYVALAPSDTVIDFDDRDSMAAMAAVDYVTPNRFNGSDFIAVLNTPTDKLAIGTQYAIFTWQAHTHSNTTQDTKTLVDIDWSKFEVVAVTKVAAKTTLKVTKQASRTKAGKAVVRVSGKAGKATGKVKATIKIAGVKKAKKVTLTLNKWGRATIKLPKAKRKGQYKTTVRYTGDKNYKVSKKTVKKYTVKK